MKNILLIMVIMMAVSCKRTNIYICEKKTEHRVRTDTGYTIRTDKETYSQTNMTKKQKEQHEKDGYDYKEYIDSTTNEIDVSITTTVSCI